MATFSSLRPGKILGRNTLDITILKSLNSLEIDRKKEIVSKRPILISKDEYNQIKPEINIVQFNPFTPSSSEPDPLSGLEVDTKSFSPRLLNWVEPYFISGLRRTLFYTEINSGLKVGDRVFIIGGNYDNNNLIEVDKYKRGRDGYKVLFVDKCQVVLDIDYTGDTPFINDSIDNFIKVQYVSDESDFLNVNKQFTTRGGQFNYKFSLNQNNIIFTESDFDSNTSFYQNGFGANRGLTSSPGFFVRDDQNLFGNGTYSWVNVSSTIMSGTFSNISSLTYSINDRIKVLGNSFNYNGQDFKEGYVYKWNVGPTQSSWIPDVKYNQPIISKSNFRSGNFKGKFNSGIYGSPNRKIKWNQSNAVFNGGTIVNTLFESGIIDSKYTLSESYTTEFDETGFPAQKTTPPNNAGRGYNFIIESDLLTSTVNKASVYGVNFGTESNSFSVVENLILSTSSNFSNEIMGGYYENCQFRNSKINNSELRVSKVLNSLSDNIKSINSSFKDSALTKSTYLSDSIIKINDYDEFIISENRNIDSTFSTTYDATHKVYKFYISESSFNRLKLSDNFYISGLKVNDGTNNLINFFDKKFKLGSYVEYFDDLDINDAFYKRGQRVDCFLSSPEDNDWTYTSVFDTPNYYTKALSQNSKKNYSVDVVVSLRDLNTSQIIDGLNFNYDTTLTPDISLTSSNVFLGNTIDISNAFIIETDFESGIFENSDWISGRNIEYNYNNNITVNTDEGGFYNLSIITQSSTIIATTSYTQWSDESSDFVYKTGSVVFFNSVYYDTRGKVDGVIITGSGSGYLSGTGITTSGGDGTGLVLDITATDIGSVLSLTISNTGTLYTDGTFSTSYGGTGSGLVLDVTVGGLNEVIVATISNPGIGYSVGDIVSIINGSSDDATVTIDSITNGEVISATISLGGIGYSLGDNIIISGGTASIQVISVTGSLTRLPDSYKVISNNNGEIYLQEVGDSGILQNLLEGGLFYTPDANNRWGYIHRSKIVKSKIKSGIFKRTYISDSLIENSDFVVDDYEFLNYDRVKSLLLIDEIFKDNKNILSKATYLHSNFVEGSDNWVNGIVYESTWNGGTFSRGLFKKSSWDSGTFESGRFYLSRSFNAIPTSDYPYYNIDNIKSYWRSGLTTATISNDRHSWRNGKFISGEFVKSDWESGELKGGSFYNSKWYSGTIEGGIFGRKSIPSSETRIFNAEVKYTTVENANFYTGDSSLYGLSSSSINWENGIFNGGLFGTDIIQSTASHTAVWKNGIFNGGEVVSNAVWENGVFNGGKFLSGYRWDISSPNITNISSSASDYAWQNGEFNGGEFGNAELGTNSTWYDGKFNGGEFIGRIWYNGILTNGTFMGGSTISPVGGYSVDGMTESNASRFVDSFTNSFYGLWNSGVVSPVVDEYITDIKIYDSIVSVRDKVRTKPKTFIKNSLWLGGKFNHGNAVFQNSVWLDGEFSRGTFDSSSFNPWVRRLGSPSQSFNLNDDLITGSGSCIWNDGILQDSDFYVSQWKTGRFLSGTAFGMIWKNGVSNYMNAFNICWNDGVWRNGNWYGSYFQYDGSINDPFNRQILFRVMNCTGTSSLHLWNVFTGNATNTNSIVNATASDTSLNDQSTQDSPVS